MNANLSNKGGVKLLVAIIMAIIVVGMILVSNPTGEDIFTRFWRAVESMGTLSVYAMGDDTLPKAGDCNSRVTHLESLVYVNGLYSCKAIAQTGMKADYMVPEETALHVNGDVQKSRNNKDAESNVIPSSVPSVQNSPVADQSNPPAQSNDDNTPSNPSDDGNNGNDGHGNNGHGNNTDGIDSSNPGRGPKNDPSVDLSNPIDDEKRGSVPTTFLSGFIFVTFKKGKRQYVAIISSWSYENGKLWLYIWGDKEVKGNCGYVNNARVVATSVSAVNRPSMPEDTLRVVRLW